MYGLKKRPKDESGLIQGAGTGTSDDVKKNVQVGSYIMPADSTQQIGTNNLKNMGSPTPVNLSNGEFQLSPDQVHSVGVQTLDAMKDQTHTPVDQPQLGFKPGQNKPELFFANGGEIPDYLKRREQNQNPMMSKGMRDALNNGFGKAPPSTGSPPKPQTPTTVPQKSNANFGLGEFDLGLEMPKVNWGQMNPFNTLSGAFSTASENKPASKDGVPDLLKRREQNPNPMMNQSIKDTLRSGFPSVAAPKPQATTPQNPKTPAPSVTDKKPVPTALPTVNATAQTQPTIQEQMNSAMWGGSQQSVSAQNPSASPASQNNPYEIQQKGNSFSYANPSAAAQARADGIREGEGLGFKVRPVNDPRGVANLFANTQEMGPTEQQIQNAIAQREMNLGLGMRGYGGRPRLPDVRTSEQEAQLQAEIARVSAPIPGSKGLTASQRNQINDLQMGYSNRANDVYKTDANNVAALQREAMGQAGQNYRTELGEQGANSRFNSNLNLEAQKFNATNDLANRQFSEEQLNNMPTRMKQAYELNLLKKYEAAKTPEERQSLTERLGMVRGQSKQQGVNPYMQIKQGEVVNEKGVVTQPSKDYLYNTQTGQTVDPLANMQSQQLNTPQVGAVINGYKYKGGDFNNPESWEKA